MGRVRHLTWGAAVALVGAVGWLLWAGFVQSPEAQLARAQRDFLKAVEERDWGEIEGMLADDYLDDLGFDRATALQTARQFLSGFFTLSLQAETLSLQATRQIGMVRMNIKAEGNGTAVSQMVLERVGRVREPWIFHWHHKGRWPWDWKVVQVQQDDLP